MTAIKELYLQNNQIDVFHPKIVKMRSLNTVDFSNNKIKKLLDNFGELNKLISMNLSGEILDLKLPNCFFFGLQRCI